MTLMSRVKNRGVAMPFPTKMIKSGTNKLGKSKESASSHRPIWALGFSKRDIQTGTTSLVNGYLKGLPWKCYSDPKVQIHTWLPLFLPVVFASKEPKHAYYS